MTHRQVTSLGNPTIPNTSLTSSQKQPLHKTSSSTPYTKTATARKASYLSLSWTFIFFNLNPADRVDHRNYILAPKDGRKAKKTIWTVFKTLKHTEKIDPNILYVNETQRYRFSTNFHIFPDALFPAATSITLSGNFNYAFAASIIVPRVEKITHLVFDNVQPNRIYAPPRLGQR